MMNESLNIEVGGKLFTPQSLEGIHEAIEVPADADKALPAGGEAKKEVGLGACILLGVVVIVLITVIHGAYIEFTQT